MPDAMVEREWLAPYHLDIRLTLSAQGRGRGDPTFLIDAGAIWRTSLTPDGPGTIQVMPVVRLAPPAALVAPAVRVPPVLLAPPAPMASLAPMAPRALMASLAPISPVEPMALAESRGSAASEEASSTSTCVRAQAWGPGANWLLDALPAALGLYDDISGFDPGCHPLIHDAARRHPGLRLSRSGRLMEALVPAILEQKVTVLEAHRAWRILLMKFGTQPPGPAPPDMRVFPDPRVWRRIPSWDWHRAGTEGVRAETIIRAACVADTLERLLDLSHEEADRKLRTIPGIGVWTSAEARQRAAGDPDAVSVGDYHLKNVVGWALAGKDRTTDEEMLELLEPFQGHRHRVTRLIGLSRGTSATRAGGSGAGSARYGAGGPPRRGPRMSVRDYRAFLPGHPFSGRERRR